MTDHTSVKNFHLIDQLATLTDHRERDALNMHLAQILMDVVKPLSITVCLVMSDRNDYRWIPVLHLRPGAPIQLRDPLHADFLTLDPVREGTPRFRCLEMNLPVAVEAAESGSPHVTILPLFAGGAMADSGIIEIASSNRLPLHELAIVDRMLHVYRNMHSMFLYSERDVLTGLANRKSFEETFYKSLHENPNFYASWAKGTAPDKNIDRRSSETNEHFWLAMVDVDHFKQVNDKFGHQIGDEVLILIARIMKNTFRGYDRVYRFGGEEFVILMRSAWHDTALATLERFRKNMEEYLFPQVGCITVSIGMNIINGGDPPDVVCNKADQAVYYAKHHGRNQVRSYMTLVEEGLIETDVKDGGIELF